MPIEGTFAAVITPRDRNGLIDASALRAWLEFLMSKGINGFAVNGATGEFCITTQAEFDHIMSIVAETVGGRATVLAGIGAAGADQAIRLARAARSGADALLLPMPYFFRYSQADLKSFTLAVAAAAPLPILLYNLPQFTTGLDPQTSLGLIRECDAIIGIKDSSGSLDTLRLLTSEGVEARRLIGNDGVLAASLAEGLVDGVVSGVACVLPELIMKLWNQGKKDAHADGFGGLTSALQQFITQLDHFPTPWGLKIIGEARGQAHAQFPFPLGSERDQQAEDFRRWFVEHQGQLEVQ